MALSIKMDDFVNHRKVEWAVRALKNVGLPVRKGSTRGSKWIVKKADGLTRH